ncbi:MAG: hypothetical protein U9N06_05375 [candidate division WOR-3 bacterium]|nr:hypothetical protein [candidate division WOR-3 bacterium]
MKRRYLFIGISLILVFFFFSCYSVPTPEVAIWEANPHGFTVSQFDYSIIDTQYTATPFNPDDYRYAMGNYEQSLTLPGNPYLVTLYHYYSDVTVDSVTFWVKNGVESYVNGYYCEFYQSSAVGQENEFLYQSTKYSDLSILLKTSTAKEDTIRVSLYDWAIRVREAVKMMYSEPYDNWQTIQVKVHFYGEDAYGDGKKFDVTQNFMLYRSD